MKKFNDDSFFSAIREMKEGYFNLDKKNYSVILTLTKRAAKTAGLSLRNNTIFKNRSEKIPCIVVPVHSLILDNCGYKEIHMQVIFIHVERVYENYCVCSLFNYKTGEDTFDSTYAFLLDDVKKIKKFAEWNPSPKIKPKEFMRFLSALYDEYFFSIKKDVISNSIGWQAVSDSFKFYPVFNQVTEKTESDFFNNIYESTFDYRRYIASTDFLNFIDIKRKSDKPYEPTCFIKTKTDMLLFSVTLYSFCRKFLMKVKTFTPFSIFVHSKKPNSFVWKYVSFWVDLFVPISEEEIYKNDLLYASNTGDQDSKKGVKMIPPSHSNEYAQNYRKPISYSRIKQLMEIEDKDIPIIIKNPSMKTKNKKALVSKNDIDILNQCEALPVLIQPEGSKILPTTDSFILVDINNEREVDLLILGAKKDQLLSLYYGFIEYLNELGKNLFSTLVFAFQCVLNDIKSQNISLINGADHYIYLWVSAYLFSYSMKPMTDYNYSITQDAFARKARQYFISMIKEISNYKPIIQLPQCFDLFKGFIKQAVANSIIKHGNGSLDSTSIGWIEINNNEKSLYLKDNYYPRFISYCEEMGLLLKYTPKDFKKHVLVEKDLLVPQYRPSSPEVNVRYDVYKKIQGEKIKTIRVDMKKLNI